LVREFWYNGQGDASRRGHPVRRDGRVSPGGVASLGAIWIAIFASQADLEYDQPAFREALYTSDLRFAVLTPEYNLRACFPYFLGGNVEVKLIHARGHCLDEALAGLRAPPRRCCPGA
jgi:hypothetical protein